VHSSPRPEVMGILNVTPDSFSDGGRHFDPETAVQAAIAMVSDGATIIDVGGESTRPGATRVTVSEEQRRVLPVIEALAGHPALGGARISVDTRNEETAMRALAAGAAMLNDVSASLHEVAAGAGAAWVAMHMAGEPATMQAAPHYEDVVDEVRSFLAERARLALRGGVSEVWVDPGIGFGKTTAHNVALLAGIDRLVADGHPVLVGVSAKRSMGVLTARSDDACSPYPPRTPGGLVGSGAEFDSVEPTVTGDRLQGSLAAASWAIIHGARGVRVHDIRATVSAVTALAGEPASG